MIHPAENIPKGKRCDGQTFRCPLLDGTDWCEIDDSLDCLDGIEVGKRGYSRRSVACLAAYPNGAVITIKPREAPCK